MKIGNHEISDNSPVFIIAELSANHQQDLKVALDTLDAMADSGADAVKLQTYTPDTLTLDSDAPYFKIDANSPWDGQNFYQLYQSAYMPWDWHAKLKEKAADLGLTWFSSPFDCTAVDLLHELDAPAYKIASFEITDLPLIEYTASKGKPVIMSTGIATEQETEKAVKACHSVGNHEIALLKCTSSYPAPYNEMNLKVIQDMRQKYGVVTGLSDHSLGTCVPVAAVALGAKIIEKHFILDRALGGPDSSFSLEPDQFKTMVESIRNVEQALGQVTYELSERARQSRRFRRSLFVVEDVKAGDLVSQKTVRSIRPGDGLEPELLPQIIGNKFKKDIKRGTPLSQCMLESS
jgi:pseudaminic acid synthase